MHQRIISALVLMFFSSMLHAQQVTISGYIKEGKSGESIIGATVFIPSKNAGTVTNAFGFYSITIPADSVQFMVTSPGYETYSTTLYPRSDLFFSISLEKDSKTALKEVTVSGRKEALQSRTQMSAVDLSMTTIKALPAFLGEVDIMKAIQLLPGVQAGNEGSSGLYVRGGGADQNLILLDGVPVYNAAHLFGFFSVFNADAIKSVEVVKGGFPARYGGRLSSVIDINMKEGDNQEFHGEGGVGLVAARLTVEGPLDKGKSSFMISGRRTYIDVLAKPIMTRDVSYYFYDLNGKVNFRLGEKDHLYLSGYSGDDKFSNTETDREHTYKTGINWGNITGVARWNHVFSPRLFGNLTAYYSRYRFGVEIEEGAERQGVQSVYKLNYSSSIKDYAVKYDFDYRPHAAHNIRFGAGFVAHHYRPGAQQSQFSGLGYNKDTAMGIQPIDGNEYDIYAEDDIRISAKLKANIGLHGTGFSIRNQFFTSLQPRLALRYLLHNQLSIKASYVQMNQFIHLLTNSSTGLPTDLWVPATDRVPPLSSQQAALGLAYTHPKGYEVTLEGYYKTMDNVIEYKEGTSFLNTTSGWEDRVVSGKGWSYGAELFIQKKKGKFTGMFGYTLSWTNRRFDALNNGETFPYRYDRRHDIKVAGVYNISSRLQVSAEWVYGTGNAITIPVAAYNATNGQKLTIYSARNGYRMPAYHRGDISVKYTTVRKRSERAWVLSVYNVYDRRNPFYIYEQEVNGVNSFKQVSLFPVIPSISYQFKF